MPSTSTDRLGGLTTSVAIKAPCRVATTTNITLSGLQTVDGTALAENDRVLVKNQSTAANNGIYVASSGTWTRAKDFDGARDAVDGTRVTVRGGTTYPDGAMFRVVATTSPPTIGTDSVAFALVEVYDWDSVDLATAFRVLQGADNSGVVDATTFFRTLLDTTIPGSMRAVIPGGTYLVSGKLSDDSIIASGGLHIHCAGDVTINVDASATAFSKLISCYTTAINNSSITGGRLTLNLNSKVSNGIYLRHAGADGGVVDWGPVTVNDAKENGASETAENQGLLVYGRYQAVYMRNPIVDTVERVNTAGVCAGITVSEFVGVCQIDAPQVARVRCPAANGNDADGIKVFSRQTGATTYHRRAGVVVLNDPVITDCEVRSIKLQTSESMIQGLRVHRKSVVASNNIYHDVSYQIGGVHYLESPFFEYLKDSGVDSIPSNWRSVAWQQQCPDGPNELYVNNATTVTETAYAQALVTVVGATATAGTWRVHGWDFVSLNGLGAALTSAVVYADAGQIQAATATHIEITGVRGNLSGAALLGYANASAANTSKLSFDIHDNENTGADHASSLVITNISGATVITQVGAFNLRDNAGFIDLLGASGWVFSANTLKVGCTFAYIRASSTFTGGPAGTAATNLRVQCLGSMAASRRCVLVTEDTGAALKFYYLQDGTNWRTNT